MNFPLHIFSIIQFTRISLWFFLSNTLLKSVYVYSFQIFGIFQVFYIFVSLFTVLLCYHYLFQLWSYNILCIICIPLNLLSVLWPRMYLANVKALEEKCTLLLLDGLFYKCQSGQFSDSVVQLFCLFFYQLLKGEC